MYLARAPTQDGQDESELINSLQMKRRRRKRGGSEGDVQEETGSKDGRGAQKSKSATKLHSAPTSCAAAAAAQLVTVRFCRLFGKCLLLKVTEREGKEADRFFNSALILAN